MSSTTRQGSATPTIEVWIDFLCPWCYIAWRRLESAVNQLDGITREDIQLRSYELDRDAPDEPTSTAVDVLAEGGQDREAILDRFDHIIELGRAEGLELNIRTARPVRTYDAHRLAHAAEEYDKRHELTERLLKAYHTENRNIADAQVLKSVAREVGLPSEFVSTTLSGETYADAVLAEEMRADDLGITGVPTICVNGSPSMYGAPTVSEIVNVFERASTGGEPDFASILEYTVDGPKQQRELADGLASMIKEWVRFHPGFLSSMLHVSTDGRKVFNIIQWASEDDYHTFTECSNTADRITALEETFAAVSGSVSTPLDGNQHGEIPRYSVYRTVLPEYAR